MLFTVAGYMVLILAGMMAFDDGRRREGTACIGLALLALGLASYLKSIEKLLRDKPQARP